MKGIEMTRPTGIVIDCSTGESKEVELSDADIAARETLAAQVAAKEAELAEQARIQAEIKASALAKLAALGLTEDEAKTIVG